MSSERTKKWKRRLPKAAGLRPATAKLVRELARGPSGRGTVADRYARIVNEVRAEAGAEEAMNDLAEAALAHVAQA